MSELTPERLAAIKSTTKIAKEQGALLNLCITEELLNYIDALIEHNEELVGLFDLQQKRMEPLTHAWQAATAKDCLPDLGAMLEWLTERAEVAERIISRLLNVVIDPVESHDGCPVGCAYKGDKCRQDKHVGKYDAELCKSHWREWAYRGDDEANLAAKKGEQSK
jgi:hypothetical protein